MSWQPIETAPKDGKSILLFSPSQEIELGREKHFVEQRVGEGLWTTSRYGEGWHYANDSCDCCWGPIVEAITHWMPLPEPPK